MYITVYLIDHSFQMGFKWWDCGPKRFHSFSFNDKWDSWLQLNHQTSFGFFELCIVYFLSFFRMCLKLFIIFGGFFSSVLSVINQRPSFYKQTIYKYMVDRTRTWIQSSLLHLLTSYYRCIEGILTVCFFIAFRHTGVSTQNSSVVEID